MALINRSEVLEALIKGLRLDTARNKIPNEVADKVLPVFKINPTPQIQIAEATASDATGATIRTTSSTKDTFLTGLFLSVAKSALSTSLHSSIAITTFQKATAVQAIRIRYEPLTAASNLNAFLMFTKPIKLARGLTIALQNNTAVASIDTHGVAYFYEVEL